jgi:nucleoid-associated protein YgaU
MGRETKILLGFLGLLAGVFMGVLSMKLLVPRPPAGAGPDVHADLGGGTPHDLVDPPAPTFNAHAFAAAPPLAPLPGAEPAAPEMYPSDRSASRAAGFTAAVPVPPAAPPQRDPFVTAASFEEPADAAAVESSAATDAGDGLGPADEGLAPTAAVAVPVDPAAATVALAGGYVVKPGDSWWSVAERSYGDGRLYRALFAWNRTANPRLTLAPGTPLDIPPLAELTAAWPQLVPRGP